MARRGGAACGPLGAERIELEAERCGRGGENHGPTCGPCACSSVRVDRRGRRRRFGRPGRQHVTIRRLLARKRGRFGTDTGRRGHHAQRHPRRRRGRGRGVVPDHRREVADGTRRRERECGEQQHDDGDRTGRTSARAGRVRVPCVRGVHVGQTLQPACHGRPGPRAWNGGEIGAPTLASRSGSRNNAVAQSPEFNVFVGSESRMGGEARGAGPAGKTFSSSFKTPRTQTSGSRQRARRPGRVCGRDP